LNIVVRTSDTEHRRTTAVVVTDDIRKNACPESPPDEKPTESGAARATPGWSR
jgi:hypothetical protein